VLNQIEHIVVLMLENRSFDCMLGKLYAPSPQFDGLTGRRAPNSTSMRQGAAYVKQQLGHFFTAG
jgi:phospholipase C